MVFIKVYYINCYNIKFFLKKNAPSLFIRKYFFKKYLLVYSPMKI